jgi:hypothetical protein
MTKFVPDGNNYTATCSMLVESFSLPAFSVPRSLMWLPRCRTRKYDIEYLVFVHIDVE